MSTTLADLKIRLDYRLATDPNAKFWTDGARTEYLDEAHKYICNYWRWPFLRRDDESTTLTIGTQGYSFPSGIQGTKIQSIRFDSTTHQIVNQVLQYEDLLDYERRVQNLTLANGIPQYYHFAYNSSGTNQIVLDIPPDFTQANALKIRYYLSATTLSVATDTVIIPDEMTHLLIKYAYQKCKEQEEEQSLSVQFLQQFNAELTLIKQDYAKTPTNTVNRFATPQKGSLYPDSFYNTSKY